MILDCITNSVTGKNENEINIERIYSLTPFGVERNDDDDVNVLAL